MVAHGYKDELPTHRLNELLALVDVVNGGRSIHLLCHCHPKLCHCVELRREILSRASTPQRVFDVPLTGHMHGAGLQSALTSSIYAVTPPPAAAPAAAPVEPPRCRLSCSRCGPTLLDSTGYYSSGFPGVTIDNMELCMGCNGPVDYQSTAGFRAYRQMTPDRPCPVARPRHRTQAATRDSRTHAVLLCRKPRQVFRLRQLAAR